MKKSSLHFPRESMLHPPQDLPRPTRTYIAIDLKSFYASAECSDRSMDPLTTNLVVADLSRTEKTICLAVSPSLKAQGIPGRPRLFEVIQIVKRINAGRLARYRKLTHNRNAAFTASSFDATALDADPSLELSYITAVPRMARYMEVSSQIYGIYLKYIAPEDIIVYSIDEVFLDATPYLSHYGMTAHDLAMTMVREVLYTTGITATAGIGTNLYLAKIAMDIVAKHVEADKDGVRIAELDEKSYREKLWTHTPLTDFWRVGRGYSRKLEANGIHTMGDVARMSLTDYGEDMLFKLFGINAELLIDHAWGWEPVTMDVIKRYKPENHSLGSGQVLHEPYGYEKAKLIVREMADLLSYDLLEKKLVTDCIVLTIGYDRESIDERGMMKNGEKYSGAVVYDGYGRRIPKHAHGTVRLGEYLKGPKGTINGEYTSSTRIITQAAVDLFERIADERLLVRRVNIVAGRVVDESDVGGTAGNRTDGTNRSGTDGTGGSRTDGTNGSAANGTGGFGGYGGFDGYGEYEQLDLFTNYAKIEEERERQKAELEKERKLQEAVVELKKKYGKNAVLKGMNLQEGARTIERNGEVGGHRA